MPRALTLGLFAPQPANPEVEQPAGNRTRTAPRLVRAARVPPDSDTKSRKPAAQLWLAIHLPQLALEALATPAHEEQDSRLRAMPRVVVDPESRQQIVLARNECARALGVRAGQSLQAAFALASGLQTLPRDAQRERARLARLAAWCQQHF